MYKNRLRELREDNDLTQKKCANIANISKQSYIRYENNLRIPTIDVISKFADYYNVSIDYICNKENKIFNNFSKNKQELIKIISKLNDKNIFLATIYCKGLFDTQN